MSKWEEKRLGELCQNIFSGGTPSTANSDYWNGEFFWLSSGETSNKYIATTSKTITKIGIKNSSTRLAKENDVVMACAGQGKTRGQTSYLKNDMYINQSIIALRVFEDKLNSKYLLHYLSLKYDELRYLSDSSSTRGSITTEMLRKMKITTPDLSTQEHIADILSAYDDLIENNNRRIELLEKSAQDLYKEWFVRFRFPNHENTKFVNGLPDGWSKGKFQKNLKYITGKLDSNAMISDGEYNFYTCAKTIYKTNTFCFDGECVLLGGNNATGDFSLFYANEKLDAYQRTYIITPINDDVSCPYIFFVIKDYLVHFKNASIGATTKFLTKSMLDKLNIILPNKEVSKKFNEIVSPVFLEISSLKIKNQNLKKQRDLLLQRLMSGKLEV